MPEALSAEEEVTVVEAGTRTASFWDIAGMAKVLGKVEISSYSCILRSSAWQGVGFAHQFNMRSIAKFC